MSDRIWKIGCNRNNLHRWGKIGTVVHKMVLFCVATLILRLEES